MKKVIFVVSIVIAISVSACSEKPVKDTVLSPEETILTETILTETILEETILTETYENSTTYWDDI